ncbi:uncharacterized protein [Montipora capricornis]|uniref:uncharacterized protein n=1 Tax=Montipora capricornis TaxID=246305 RepID=UPI0035F213BD
MAVSVDEAIRESLRLFPNVPDVKEKQKKCIELLLKRKDVLGLLLTGFGKSLIYQLFPSVFETMNCKGAHVLVVSALKAISNEQMEELNDLGIPASEVAISEQEDLKILRGEYSLIFGSAEMLLKKEWLDKFKKSKLMGTVELLVVDEAHVSQTWGKSSHRRKAFRAAYGELSTLRSFLKPGTPVLALTATVEWKSRVNLIKLLGMQAPEIVDVSINNENIRFSVQKIKKGLQCFKSGLL